MTNRFRFQWASPAAGSRCDRCLDPIDADAPRVEAQLEPIWRPESSLRFALHPACALDVDTRSFAALLEGDGAAFAQRDELERLLATRLRAIEHRRDRAQRAARSEEPSASEDPSPPVSPARDPLGRPRVRVSIVSNGTVLDSRTSTSFWRRLRVLQSWCSPRREYVFAQTHEGGYVDDDPAQPMIAHVYASLAKKGALTDRSDRLWTHRALGFHRPLLWLIGIKQWKRTDPNVLAVRELVASQAIDPDDCPVLCAPRIDEAALDALVLALDEHFDGRARSFTGAPALAIAETLERDLLSGHPFDDAQLSQIGQRTRLSPTAQSKAVNERVALWLIAHGRVAAVQSLLVEKTHTSSAPLRAWFDAVCANGAALVQEPHAVEAHVPPMLQMLAAFDRASAVLAATRLFVALEQPPRYPARLPSLRAEIAKYAASDDLPALTRAMESAPTDEHRRQLALLIATIEDRADAGDAMAPRT